MEAENNVKDDEELEELLAAGYAAASLADALGWERYEVWRGQLNVKLEDDAH